MGNPGLRRSILALSHPATILAVVVMLANDHVFKRLWDSWWTGKLSDVAWVVFTPFIFAAALSLIAPRRFRGSERTIAAIALGTVGVWYALYNLSAPAHVATLRLLSVLSGWEVFMARDATDVIAIPIGLAVSVWVWLRPIQPRPWLETRGWIVASLCALATVATSYGDYTLGVYCFVEKDGVINALVGPELDEVYSTDDGGLTWTWVAPWADAACDYDSRHAGVVSIPDSRIQYRFARGAGIDRSTDGGATWTKLVDTAALTMEARAY
ncbi:MAG: exo-alpha-sialidase [SAR202 cluster bacterium]|nr:exo-alpha-sialidase [SAR202 cluster bacterium]